MVTHVSRIQEAPSSIPGADQSIVLSGFSIFKTNAGLEFNLYFSRTFLSFVLCVCVVSKRRPVLWADHSPLDSLHCPYLNVCDSEYFLHLRDTLFPMKWDVKDEKEKRDKFQNEEIEIITKKFIQLPWPEPNAFAYSPGYPISISGVVIFLIEAFPRSSLNSMRTDRKM